MSAGIAKCIADVFRNDVLNNGTASGYAATYPLVFNAASAVPAFLYTCLKDIWLQGTAASGYTNTQWSNVVVDTYSYGLSGSRTINVVPYRVVDQVDAPGDGPTSNTSGAEFSEVFIYFKIGGNLSAADVDRITQAELRVRRLIDYGYAVNTKGAVEIPITDNTINPRADVKAYWQGFVNAAPDKELAACYWTYYERLLLR